MGRPLDPDRPRRPLPVIGGKYVRRLDALVRAPRPQGAHGNRLLHLDDVPACSLLASFNPAIRSPRTVEDFSQAREARRHLASIAPPGAPRPTPGGSPTRPSS